MNSGASTRSATTRGTPSPTKKAKDALQEFAKVTGGHAYFPKSIDEVEGLCRRIAHEIRNQYTLGYSSSNRKRDGAWRDVSVKVNPPRNVKIEEVRSKPGYYAVASARSAIPLISDV